jgi:hypothetical protein
MPVFTYVAGAVATWYAGLTVSAVVGFAIRTLATVAISSLIANRANKKSSGASDVGARVQLGPATNNKLAVSYGSAFLAPTVTDAKITTDQKTMYYVFSLCEASSGTMSFGKIFWNGKEVTLGAGDYGANNKVVSLTTNATPPQVDDTINGHAWIYQFRDGSSSGVNTSGVTAISILSDSSIPAVDRWTSTDTMTDTCFIVVKVIYNKDVQDSQQMPRLSVQLTNTLTKPGAVFLDYMTNTTYGCAIDVANIDTASLTALDVYSDQLITYVPVGGGTTTQPRYRIDGPINTGDNCLSNLQQLADACDSWLQYSELTGKWTIVMNKPYTGTLASLYSVDSSVLIGGIDINPLDLNQTYNSLEVQYPNANINDQTDYKVVDLTTSGTAWYNPSLLSPNEPNNRLTIQYPQINNYIRAVYLGVRRLLQSREDLTIVCNLDYSGIQVVAGDVVRVTLAEYGWTDKLFRVSQVQETKTTDGFLGARITAFEYNASVYADNALDDFIPEANTGLTDPNIFDRPGVPIVSTNVLANSGAVKSFTVTSSVPVSGTTVYMDFNYGNSTNVAAHKSYTSTQLADGTPYTNGANVSIEINDLPVGNYYFSTTARNELAGRASFSSTVFNWNAGLQANSVTGGANGAIQSNTITNNNIFPATILGGSISANTITYTNMGSGTGAENIIATYNYEVAEPVPNIVNLPVNITTFGSNVKANNYDTPKFVNGTTVSSTEYYPYYQGTSLITNGYLANSTSQYNPADATQFSDLSGVDDWYAVDYKTFSTAVSAAESFRMEYGCAIVANANTTVQFAAFLTFAGFPYMAFQTDDSLTTYELIANQPRFINFTVYQAGELSVDGAGMAFRNMVSGTRVDFTRGLLISYRQKS